MSIMYTSSKFETFQNFVFYSFQLKTLKIKNGFLIKDF